jgi:hypothetical protein
MSTSTPIRALVVFESMFGNTEKVAGAVAHGLQLEGIETGLVSVDSAPLRLDPEIDLLVVGGPTHAFSLSRASTRQDAVRQGAPGERATTGLREWLGLVLLEPGHAPQLAAFDTRAEKVRWLPAAAGPAAVRLARRRGVHATTKPVGFVVEDISGPLAEGELERAVAWGRQLGQECAQRAAVG